MPSHTPAEIRKRNKELQESTFPARRKAASEKIAKSQSSGKKLSNEQVAKNNRALEALGRLRERMDSPGTQQAALIKPSSPKKKKAKTPAERRRPFEKVLPGDPAGKLRKIAEAAKAKRKARG